jgi:hypothetical protein
MTTAPAEALALLRDRVAGVLADHGLDTWQLVFTPETPGRLGIHIFAGLAQEAGPATDDAFDQVIASAAQAEVDQRAQRSIDELTRKLRRDGGFLDFSD